MRKAIVSEAAKAAGPPTVMMARPVARASLFMAFLLQVVGRADGMLSRLAATHAAWHGKTRDHAG